MKTSNKTGILVDGSFRSAGVTFYTRNGKTIVRCAKSRQPKRCTMADGRVVMVWFWGVVNGVLVNFC